MIYYYKHKSINDYSREKIDLLGFEGIKKFSEENGLNANEIYREVQQLEASIKALNAQPYRTDVGRCKELIDKATQEYINFFNNNSKHDRQAYIVIGNIASGKSYVSKKISTATNSMIIDSDYFKMGKVTEKGFFEGLSSLYLPLERDKVQAPCGDATKIVIDQATSNGMNIILPKASTSIEKLERQLQILEDRNYDIHLILVDTPLEICANKNYYRFLIKEYAKQPDPNGNIKHGRFVPVSVVKCFNDPVFDTFAKAYKKQRYKSYTALYGTENTKEEIDLQTMILE